MRATVAHVWSCSVPSNGCWWRPAAPSAWRAALRPGPSGQAHRQSLARLAHPAAFIVLPRATGEGQITLDRHGDPVIPYWPNETDRRHLVRGMQEVTRIVFAGGGVGVSSLHAPPLRLDSEGGGPGAVGQARRARRPRGAARRGARLD